VEGHIRREKITRRLKGFRVNIVEKRNPGEGKGGNPFFRTEQKKGLAVRGPPPGGKKRSSRENEEGPRGTKGPKIVPVQRGEDSFIFHVGGEVCVEGDSTHELSSRKREKSSERERARGAG